MAVFGGIDRQDFREVRRMRPTFKHEVCGAGAADRAG